MPSQIPETVIRAFEAALCESEKFIGATAPNPAVGAAMLDAEGRLLGVAAHQKAGTEHAEARLIRQLQESGLISRAHTLIVTLEPCNHQGRTPPCTQAIITNPQIREVWVGAADPNPKVRGKGRNSLEIAGLSVRFLEEGDIAYTACHRLAAPFVKQVTTGTPWVVVKSAHRFSSVDDQRRYFDSFDSLLDDKTLLRTSMLPEPGSKTFTSASSLRHAHELRRQSDALITGAGTIVADDPSFTVRHVTDHPGKIRILYALDPHSRVSQEWLDISRSRGFDVRIVRKRIPWTELFRALGDEGVLQVMVEAGPTILTEVLASGLWDEHTAYLVSADAPDLRLCRSR